MGNVWDAECKKCGFKGMVQVTGGFFSRDTKFSDTIPVVEERNKPPYGQEQKCPKCGEWGLGAVKGGSMIFFD